ncbi:MAG: hypothetical protein GY950_26295 [bacterium]|nr:hypothetical protein [bacterium]
MPFLLDCQSSARTIPELKKQVAGIGKLGFKFDVPVRYLDKNRLRNYISDLVEKEYPDQLARKEAMFIQLMGFSKKRLNVKKIRKKILVTNAGGVYNEKTKELLALEEYRTVDLMNSMILAHELRHAVQDAHFDIQAILGERSDFDDRKLAVLSAIEGDATFVAVMYNGFDPRVMSSTFSSDPLVSFSPIGNTAQLYKAPGIIKHQMTMPYVKGMRFVSEVFKKKKWKGVNRILKFPPDSTEQILHPEKYLKREKPVEVEVLYRPDGYKLYHSGVIGEYYLNILLIEKQSGKYGEPAVGWGGDTFKIYLKPSSYFLIWKAVWDEETFCGNFYFDLKRFVERTFEVDFKDGNLKGSLFAAGQAAAPGKSGAPADDYFFIRKIRNEIIYVRTNDRKQMNTFIYGGNYD